jgi:hypothetical protein
VTAELNLKVRIFHIAFIALLGLTGWFSSCKPKHICPAYQSSFYLDQKAAALEFSPFDKDTMPKLENLVRKTDVLLIVRLGKKKIENRMAVIPMITIYPDADSSIASSDSLAADSLAADDELLPEEGDEAAQDSTSVDESEKSGAGEETPDEGAKPKDEEEPEAAEDPEKPKAEPEIEQKKPSRKKSEKDPELSDPSLKYEFEESFQDSIPEDEILNPIPDEEEIPLPKEGGKRRPAPLNGDADKPKEEKAEDDKF